MSTTQNKTASNTINTCRQFINKLLAINYLQLISNCSKLLISNCSKLLISARNFYQFTAAYKHTNLTGKLHQ